MDVGAFSACRGRASTVPTRPGIRHRLVHSGARRDLRRPPIYGVEPSSGMRRASVADAGHSCGDLAGRLGLRDSVAGWERGPRAAVPLTPCSGQGGRRGRSPQSAAPWWQRSVPQHLRRPASRRRLAGLLPSHGRGRGGGGDVPDVVANRGRVRGGRTALGHFGGGARRGRRGCRSVCGAPACASRLDVRIPSPKTRSNGASRGWIRSRVENTRLPDRGGRRSACPRAAGLSSLPDRRCGRGRPRPLGRGLPSLRVASSSGGGTRRRHRARRAPARASSRCSAAACRRRDS